MKPFFAHGKLLISAEYMVLHGSLALALPLHKGQTLQRLRSEDRNVFSWDAYEAENLWFSAKFNPTTLGIIETSDQEKAENLRFLIKTLIEMDPSFQRELFTWDVETVLGFSPKWGFGSSSTLIALMAEWAEVNPLDLHFRVSDGSGYDVACALAERPIHYKLREDGPHYRHVKFNPPFAKNLYFVWLGKKQSTAEHLVDGCLLRRPSAARAIRVPFRMARRLRIGISRGECTVQNRRSERCVPANQVMTICCNCR